MPCLPRINIGAAMILAGALVLLLSGPVFAEQDPEVRLELLQRQMENAVSQGRGIPPGLMEEMQKILDEILKGDTEDKPKQEISGVPVAFSGTVRISVSSSGSCGIDGSSFSSSSQASAITVIHGSREERNQDGEIEDYIPQGKVQTQISGKWRQVSVDEDGNRITATRTYTGSDQREFGGDGAKAVSLYVDPQRGVYRIYLPGGGVAATVKEIIAGPMASESKTYTQTVSVGAIDEKIGMDVANEYPYSPGAGGLHHAYTVTTWASLVAGEPAFGPGMPENDPVLAIMRQEGGGTLFPVTVSVSWSLHLKGSEVEAVIEPEGNYDNWLPTGGVAGAGNLVKAKVRIIKPQGAKGYITFRLADVSQVPGECMNAPIRDPDSHWDLQFIKTGSSKGIWIAPDGLEAVTENEVSEAVIAVRPLDYGAWGRLEADIKMVVKGREQETRAVFKVMGTNWLNLPRDDDGDRVADSWVRHIGISENASEDNDAKPGKQYPGDGLSVYEEYRGFMVKGRHTRTDPRFKDLFIHDPDDLIPQSKVTSGALGELRVHLVDPDEIKLAPGSQHRMINFNFDPPNHVVDQHGLPVYIGDRDNIGHTFESITNTDARLGPPVDNDRIEVNPNYIFKQIRSVVSNFREAYNKDMGPDWPDENWYEARLAETIAFCVAHEVSHGVGVRHHEPENAPPYSCLMSQPEMGGYNGYCAYNLFKGEYMWGFKLCPQCKEGIMVSDLYEGQGYLPDPGKD